MLSEQLAFRPLPNLFSREVAQYSVAFDREYRDPVGLAAGLGVQLPDSVRASVPQRQCVFIAGRVSAREALREVLGMNDIPEIPVGIGGMPMWPANVAGSITHTNNVAAAVVARADHARGLGVDLEQMMSAERASALTGAIAHPDELDDVSAKTSLSPSEALTLIFSAKEALFKCLFPVVGHYFEFLDTRITVIEARNELACRLLVSLGPFTAGRSISGRFEIFDEHVITGCVLPP